MAKRLDKYLTADGQEVIPNQSVLYTLQWESNSVVEEGDLIIAIDTVINRKYLCLIDLSKCKCKFGFDSLRGKQYLQLPVGYVMFLDELYAYPFNVIEAEFIRVNEKIKHLEEERRQVADFQGKVSEYLR